MSYDAPDRATQLGWLLGPCQSRGHRWARQLRAEFARRRRPWEPLQVTERVQALARERLADLHVDDAELEAQLVAEFLRGATREWGRGPGGR